MVWCIPSAVCGPAGGNGYTGEMTLQISRRQMIAASAAGFLAACSRAPMGTVGGPPPALPPLIFDPDRVSRTLVCLRPFRASGPRIERERFDTKALVHNYGHGGSGWSLSWGSADLATAMARNAGDGPYAVLGAGVIGLTTAIRLAETGADVTIYAENIGQETPSARATGVWSPSSRVAFKNAVEPSFPDWWERLARISYAEHYAYLSHPDAPVEFVPQYSVAGGVQEGERATHEWLHLWGRLGGLIPRSRAVDGLDNPFPRRDVRAGTVMVFNIAQYFNVLRARFAAAGGKIEQRRFTDRSQILALPQKVIANCTGYGARALWNDRTLTPVRGQVTHLPPQTDARYALYFDAVQAVSRSDALIVQYLGSNDDYGFGLDNRQVDQEEQALALARMGNLYA